MATVSNRDPYPFPRLLNDENFTGIKTCNNKKDDFRLPTHLAQQIDPWNRLNTKHTLSSCRHETYHFDPKSPNDSLDFILKAKYSNGDALFSNKNEILFQRETFDKDHAGRKLKNRVVIEPEVPLPLNHPIIIQQQKKMESPHSVKLAIVSHHTQTTNKGYSRKPDGGFFTS